jgi:hypothetical protein
MSRLFPRTSVCFFLDNPENVCYTVLGHELCNLMKEVINLPKNTSRIGRTAEQKVAKQLRNAGASVKVSPASRGAADMIAKFPTKTWAVQVKAGQTPPTKLSGTDKQRLNLKGTNSKATPVLATVTQDGIEYRSNRSDRKLKP